MQTRTDLEDLDVVIRRRGGRYLASVPQLGLYATAEGLVQVVEAVEAKRRCLLDELSSADALDQVGVTSAAPAVKMQILPSLAVFAAKGVIVVALVMAAVGFTRHAVQSEIEQLRAPKIGGVVFWDNVENDIIRAADPANDMPAAKKRELLSALHILVDRWRPFTMEAGRLFSVSDISPPQPTEVSKP